MTLAPAVVLAIAPNWLGDAVMALPAMADLKRHFAGTRLIVAARASVAEVFRLAPIVDEVETLTWRGGIFNRQALQSDARRLSATGATVSLLLPNSFASGWLVRQAGIAERWGYATDLRARLLTRTVPRPKGSRHQGEYYQHLVAELGAARGPLAPELRATAQGIESARRLLNERGWDGAASIVSLAPGAAYGRAKQWLPAHVVALVTTLSRQGTVCVLLGSGADAATTRRIREMLPADCAPATIDLAGATSLAELAGVLSLSRACVANDSGAMHVAAALGTPVVALFGPTRERETRPLTVPGGWAQVLTSPVWCRPCMLRECPLDHRCMSGITPDMVTNVLGEVPSAQMSNGPSR